LKNRENVGGGVPLSVVEDLELRRTPFLFSLSNETDEETN